MIRALILAFLLLLPHAVLANTTSCRLPERIESQACGARGPAHGAPGDFDYYVLALSWSPQFCAEAGGKPAFRHQCSANRFGFVVHGLWPQYRDRPGNMSWPQYCRPAKALPEALLRRHLCRLPGEVLMNCQWAKHGSCTGLEPTAYFEQIEQLMQALTLPDIPRGKQRAGAVIDPLLRANPQLRAEAVALIVRDDALAEIRLCYAKNLTEFVACDRAVGGSSRNRELLVR